MAERKMSKLASIMLAIEGPAESWCPWCGEETGGEFCDGFCRRAYWADVAASRKSEPQQSHEATE